MENYPGNSKRDRASIQEPKKVDKVISGEVTFRKKPLGRRIFETFFGSADSVGAWGYVVHEVLVPAAKDMVSDAVTGGIERALYGDARPRSRARGGTPYSNYRNYSSYSSGPIGGRRDREDRLEEITHRARASNDPSQVIVPSRAEAQEVIDGMFRLIEEYDVATVADFCGLLGVTSQFTDEKYGWHDIRGYDIRRTQGGYLVDLPRPRPLID